MTNKVSEILSTHNITKTRFAIDFKLSRPTLDEYISKFEEGIEISKDKYQLIFVSLFSEELPHYEFMIRYKRLSKMISRDKVLDIDDLDPISTDYLIETVHILKNNSSESNYLLRFVNFLCKEYQANSKLTILLVKYFIYLNNLGDFHFDDFEKRYLGNFYYLNSTYLDNPEDLDLGKYKEFSKRRREIALKNKIRSEEVNDKINALINNLINEALNESDDEDDIDSIINSILERFKK